MWMNAEEVDHALDVIRRRAPELAPYAQFLRDWKDIVNENSDGWHSWPGGGRAASKLMALIDAAARSGAQPSEKELKAALSPIKAAATKHGLPVPTLDEGDDTVTCEHCGAENVKGDRAECCDEAREESSGRMIWVMNYQVDDDQQIELFSTIEKAKKYAEECVSNSGVRSLSSVTWTQDDDGAWVLGNSEFGVAVIVSEQPVDDPPEFE